jgi:hypothetical protein
VRRHLVTLALVVPMLTAAWLVLRAPDVAQAIAFFGPGTPSLTAGEAMMTLLAWLAVSVACCGTLLPLFRRIVRTTAARHSTSIAVLFFVIGLLLLTMGAVQRALPSASVCCGSGAANVREAMQLAR